MKKTKGKPSERIKAIFEQQSQYREPVWGANAMDAVEAIVTYLDEQHAAEQGGG